MSGLDRFVAYEKGVFVGRDTVWAERERGRPKKRLVTLAANAVDFEPVFASDHPVGHVTSAADDLTALSVDVVGMRRGARIIPPSPIDPNGSRMRQ